MQFTVESVHVNVPKHVKKIEQGDFGLYAASTWHRMYEPFVPMDEGNLAHNITLDPWQITHNEIYAHYQYEGEDFNFRKQPHPQAAAHWDQVARATKEAAFLADLQAYIDSGRLFK